MSPNFQIGGGGGEKKHVLGLSGEIQDTDL